MIMFDKLTKSICKDFLTNVKQAKSSWIKGPKNFDCIHSMIDLTNLHTNDTSTVHWTNDEEDSVANIITLEMALNHEQMKNNNYPNKSTTPGVQPGLELCNFLHNGKLETLYGVKFVFCK